MKKPDLFLHIGIPKTGSSALQMFFVIHAEQMLEQGLYYPDTNNQFSEVIKSGLTSGNAEPLWNIHTKYNYSVEKFRLNTDQWIQKLIQESKAYTFNTMLLSCESLSALNRRQWAVLEESLNEYFDLHLIAYFREPYSWVFSSWLQVVKRNGAQGWLNTATPKNDWVALIVPKMLSDNLLKNFIQLSFEECKSDLIGSFFRAINLPISYSNSDDKPLKNKINLSITDQELTLQLLVNRITNGDRSIKIVCTDTFIEKTFKAPCYFYSPEVDGMIDVFLLEYGIKRQYLCTNLGPVVYSEKNWYETHTVDAALIEFIFFKLSEYFILYEKQFIQRAINMATYYKDSDFCALVPEEFQVISYILLNQDVLVTHVDPYKHYVKYGSAEGRRFGWGLLSINAEKKGAKKHFLRRKIYALFFSVRYGAVKLQRNLSLTHQKLTSMLSISRITNVDSSFGRLSADTLFENTIKAECCFHPPEVYGMIDVFMFESGLKSQYLRTKHDPVVYSEMNWLETHPVDSTLIESLFSKLGVYYKTLSNELISRAINMATYYKDSDFCALVPKKFDVMAYIILNQDLLGSGVDPYEHYVKDGKAEGRSFNWG
jgi:hypothetical protein